MKLFRYFVIITCLVILFFVFFPKNKSNYQQKNNYQVGNYTITIPKNYIYESDYTESRGYGLSTTKLDPKYNQIGGVHSLFLNKKIAGLSQELSPTFTAYSWNNDLLEYSNDNTKKLFTDWAKQLVNLNKYQDINLLSETVSLDIYDAKAYHEPNVYFSNFISYSKIFSYPILIRKIDTEKFDLVYYVEVFEGNGDLGSATKKLIINNQSDFLFISEGSANYNFLDQEHCRIILDRAKLFTCVKDVWEEKYRNEEEVAKWINDLIASIEYKK